MLCELPSLSEFELADGTRVGSVTIVGSEMVIQVTYFGCCGLTDRTDVNRIVPICRFVYLILSLELPFLTFLKLGGANSLAQDHSLFLDFLTH